MILDRLELTQLQALPARGDQVPGRHHRHPREQRHGQVEPGAGNLLCALWRAGNRDLGRLHRLVIRGTKGEVRGRLDFRIGGDTYTVIRTFKKGKTVTHDAEFLQEQETDGNGGEPGRGRGEADARHGAGGLPEHHLRRPRRTSSRSSRTRPGNGRNGSSGRSGSIT